jgi:hypothetical protein
VDLETIEVDGACAECRDGGSGHGHFACAPTRAEALAEHGWVLVGDEYRDGSWVATMERPAAKGTTGGDVMRFDDVLWFLDNGVGPFLSHDPALLRRRRAHFHGPLARKLARVGASRSKARRWMAAVRRAGVYCEGA